MSLNETLNLLSYIQDIYDVDLTERPCSDLSISIKFGTYYVIYSNSSSKDIITFSIDKDNVDKYFED